MQVSIDVSDSTFSRLALVAHENNQTVQQVITSILETMVPASSKRTIREEDLPHVEFY